jgi:cobalamin-dependent methionine synthase I
MILIAENLNSSIPQVRQALETKDSAWIQSTASRLCSSPADYLDLNAGIFHQQEAVYLRYLISQVTPVCPKPLVLDSPDPEVIRQMAEALRQASWQPDPCFARKPALIFNSITLEGKRCQPLLDTALQFDAGLVALLMGQEMPHGVDERLDIAGKLVSRLTASGIPAAHIFLDPCVRPVATDDQAGLEALEIIRQVRVQFPETHVVVGLSNISFGLPARRHLNRAFLLQALAMGLDSAILNPLDEDLLALLYAGLAIGGQDEFCLDYLSHYRPSGTRKAEE